MWYYERFPKAAPRPKAALGKERKKFGETWWGQKWVEILSKYEDDQRMSRGRAYARADKVKNFKLEKGKISAKVQGNSGTYTVKIAFQQYKNNEWRKITHTIRATPLLLGKLLNNEMPQELEDTTGYTFIPKSFSADCSCPDYVNPCKHTAAVFYTLADEIDHNPLKLFLLHGLSSDELFSQLAMTNIMLPQKKVQKEKKGNKKSLLAKEPKIPAKAGSAKKKKNPRSSPKVKKDG